VVVTYPLANGRQYPLRGIEVELWEDVPDGDDLRLEPGDTLMAWLRLVDGNSGELHGVWPNHGQAANPSSFRALFFQWLKLYLPLTIR